DAVEVRVPASRDVSLRRDECVLARRVQHAVTERAHVARGLEALGGPHRPPPSVHERDCSLVEIVRAYLRSLDPRLSRPLWTLLSGSLANAFGNGVVFPFLLIYLHNVRGIGVGTAGLILAGTSVTAVAETRDQGCDEGRG